ncbi:Hypothetical protein, putative [Bodo saltans]|uniref:Uncharacterized protein n=1 Tax=Bodo saltans TaxID=75058 RepID=A0A0S4KHB1_BODSA|nr:Hypothetical protein, putative [Bodo saltans]|eukprot:CUI14495.1 Hypothetical protein, putative [Bodo saltans]
MWADTTNFVSPPPPPLKNSFFFFKKKPTLNCPLPNCSLPVHITTHIPFDSVSCPSIVAPPPLIYSHFCVCFSFPLFL